MSSISFSISDLDTPSSIFLSVWAATTATIRSATGSWYIFSNLPSVDTTFNIPVISSLRSEYLLSKPVLTNSSSHSNLSQSSLYATILYLIDSNLSLSLVSGATTDKDSPEADILIFFIASSFNPLMFIIYPPSIL